jgi:hypothetical protein
LFKAENIENYWFNLYIYNMTLSSRDIDKAINNKSIFHDEPQLKNPNPVDGKYPSTYNSEKTHNLKGILLNLELQRLDLTETTPESLMTLDLTNLQKGDIVVANVSQFKAKPVNIIWQVINSAEPDIFNPTNRDSYSKTLVKEISGSARPFNGEPQANEGSTYYIGGQTSQKDSPQQNVLLRNFNVNITTTDGRIITGKPLTGFAVLRKNPAGEYILLNQDLLKNEPLLEGSQTYHIIDQMFNILKEKYLIPEIESIKQITDYCNHHWHNQPEYDYENGFHLQPFVNYTVYSDYSDNPDGYYQELSVSDDTTHIEYQVRHSPNTLIPLEKSFQLVKVHRLRNSADPLDQPNPAYEVHYIYSNNPRLNGAMGVRVYNGEDGEGLFDVTISNSVLHTQDDRQNLKEEDQLEAKIEMDNLVIYKNGSIDIIAPIKNETATIDMLQQTIDEEGNNLEKSW